MNEETLESYLQRHINAGCCDHKVTALLALNEVDKRMFCIQPIETTANDKSERVYAVTNNLLFIPNPELFWEEEYPDE